MVSKLDTRDRCCVLWRTVDVAIARTSSGCWKRSTAPAKFNLRGVGVDCGKQTRRWLAIQERCHRFAACSLCHPILRLLGRPSLTYLGGGLVLSLERGFEDAAEFFFALASWSWINAGILFSSATFAASFSHPTHPFLFASAMIPRVYLSTRFSPRPIRNP